MDTLLYWKEDINTKRVLSEIQQEIHRVKEELTNTTLVLNSKDNSTLVREYTYNIGMLEGLKYIENMLEVIAEDNQDSKEEDNDRDSQDSRSNTFY